VVAELGSGVPKEWIELHYKSRKAPAGGDPVAQSLARREQLRRWLLECDGEGDLLPYAQRFFTAGYEDVGWLVQKLSVDRGVLEATAPELRAELAREQGLISVDGLISELNLPTRPARKVRSALERLVAACEALDDGGVGPGGAASSSQAMLAVLLPGVPVGAGKAQSAFDNVLAFTPIKDSLDKIAAGK
jgi:hypothetical protein